MKIGGFEPLSLCDFPGTPAAVIFTQGCNWCCRYCHNNSLIPLKGEQHYRAETLLRTLKERQQCLDGVVLSGGEPTLQADLADFVTELKAMGFKVKLDTNGSRPVVLESLIAGNCLDYIAMDIKAPWQKYKAITGVAEINVSVVQESMRLIAASFIPHHFRTTYSRRHLTKEDMEKVGEAIPPDSSYVVQPCLDRP